MFFDYHVHSSCSHDCVESMEDTARAAITAGVGELCFTDHFELEGPEGHPYPPLDDAAYFTSLRQARQAVPGIVLKAGVELGLTANTLDGMAAYVREHDLDFVIASQHMIDGKDPYFPGFHEGTTVPNAQRRYLEELLYCIERLDDYNVIGHIGYLDKYLTKEQLAQGDRPFVYEDFPELIDKILRSAIERGKGIEVNTNNYFMHDWPCPHPDILKRFAQLGGEVVTTGSDAHSADVVGNKLKEAQELIQACGLKYVCTFEKMEPIFHKL